MSRQSVRSITSSIAEVGGVTFAVEQLQELGRRMRSENFNFKEDDVGNIDVVVESIQELEKERLRLHELLETETIRGSVLRHRLLFYPAEIQKEIDEAVISARQSNEEAQKNLQDTLQSIYTKIEFLEERQSQLEKENAVLHPDREQIRYQHEEIISQLNQRMAEKAGTQITLNETRDKVRQANQCILDLEDGIIQLKEDLIQERQEAREEKKRLKNAVNDTTKKTKEQRAENFEKKKQLDVLREDLVESEGQLEVLKKSIRRLDNSRGKLQDKEMLLTAQLTKETSDNLTLRERGIAIREETRREEETFEAQRLQFEAQIKQLDEEIAEQHERSERVDVQHAELEIEVKEKMEIQKKNRAKVKEIEKMLQTAKEALSNKAEETGVLDSDNQIIQQNIEDMQESHKIVVAQHNSHIEEYREQLSKERKERMELQTERDSIQKDLDDLKQDSQNFMTEINKKINEGKTKHQELSKEGTHLQKQLREDDALLRKLQKELAEAQKKFKQDNTEKKQKLSHIEEEMAQMEITVKEKREKLELQTPAFQALEKEFEEKTESYDTMKKDIVKKKNHKTSLQDDIKRTKSDLQKVYVPQVEMKETLQRKRKESIQQLKSHAERTKEMEMDIYVAKCKLQTVEDENRNFQEHIVKLEDGIKDMKSREIENMNVIEKLREELTRLKDELLQGWKDDREMQQFFARRDEAVVNELAEILLKTENREKKIADISSQLETELVILGEFLDNVSRRRPLDTREGRRPQTQPVESVQTVIHVSSTNDEKYPLASPPVESKLAE